MAPRVDHGDGNRQLGVGLVVIRDDQIDAQLARALRRLDAANAAVHRDDERHAIGLQAIERLGLKAVAVLDAIGKEVDDVGAEQLQRAAKNDRGRDAVAVVIAVDGDALFPLDRRENPLDRRRHVREHEGIVQMIERRPEKSLRALEIVDPANHQQPRDRRADLQLARQHRRGLVIAGETFPEERNRHVFYVSPQRRNDAKHG